MFTLPLDTANLPHDDLSPTLLAIAISLYILACMVVLARIYSKLGLLKTSLTWDDYCMLAAVLASLCTTVSHGLEIRNGMGKHIWDLPPNATPGKFGSVAYISYILSLGFIKASILLQLIRLTLAPSPILKFILTLTTLATIGTIITVIAMRCITVDKTEFERVCLKNNTIMQIVLVTLNTTTDLVVWIAPIRLILKTRFQRRQKVVLVVSFTLSSLMWIASVARLSYVITHSHKEQKKRDVDFTYEAVPMMITTVVEVNAGILFGCIPSLHPLARRWIPGFTDSKRARNIEGARLSDVQLETYKSAGGEMGLGRVGDVARGQVAVSGEEGELVSGVEEKKKAEGDIETGRLGVGQLLEEKRSYESGLSGSRLNEVSTEELVAGGVGMLMSRPTLKKEGNCGL